MDDTKERNRLIAKREVLRQVVALREQGLTYRQIGEHFDRRVDWVAQKISQAQRVDLGKPINDDFILSVRSARALSETFGRNWRDKLSAISATGAKELSKICNIGPVSVREIAAFLESKGLTLAP